jgi:hypothetical protein
MNNMITFPGVEHPGRLVRGAGVIATPARVVKAGPPPTTASM